MSQAKTDPVGTVAEIMGFPALEQALANIEPPHRAVFVAALRQIVDRLEALDAPVCPGPKRQSIDGCHGAVTICPSPGAKRCAACVQLSRAA